MTIKFSKRVSHVIKFAWLKIDEHNHNDDQILKARVSHMIKFAWLETDKHNHNDNQILKARVSHMIKFAWLKIDEQFFYKGKQKSRRTEAQENFASATNEENACVNHLTRKSPCIKGDGTRILGHEGEIKPPKTFHIPMFIQTKDDKGIKGAIDK